MDFTITSHDPSIPTSSTALTSTLVSPTSRKPPQMLSTLGHALLHTLPKLTLSNWGDWAPAIREILRCEYPGFNIDIQTMNGPHEIKQLAAILAFTLSTEILLLLGQSDLWDGNTLWARINETTRLTRVRLYVKLRSAHDAMKYSPEDDFEVFLNEQRGIVILSEMLEIQRTPCLDFVVGLICSLPEAHRQALLELPNLETVTDEEAKAAMAGVKMRSGLEYGSKSMNDLGLLFCGKHPRAWQDGDGNDNDAKRPRLIEWPEGAFGMQHFVALDQE